MLANIDSESSLFYERRQIYKTIILHAVYMGVKLVLAGV